MIKLTRFRTTGSEFVLNADLIESVEATPDTVITLTTGHKFIVEEPVDQVIRLVIAFKQQCHMPFEGGGQEQP